MAATPPELRAVKAAAQRHAAAAAARDNAIRVAAQTQSLRAIAAVAGVSFVRVHQIVNHR